MENFNAVLSGRGRRFQPMRRTKMESVHNNVNITSHEGIRTIGVDNNCNSSSSSSDSDVCIRLVTWNMNGKASYEDLVGLIGSARNFDLLVVGLQEVPRKKIAPLLQIALAETHVLLAKAIMQSLQLYVFGPKNSESFIRELMVDEYSAGGCGGLIRRKKGAVAIRINYNGTRMVFISCHLSAHARNVEERNTQCRHISHSLFSKKLNPYAGQAQVTVWLGDLNYRIQGIQTNPVRTLIQRGLQRFLTSRDQLLREAERGQIFEGYCEGTLNFKPTYKYDAGSSNYDTSHKVRVPSWTDRILFKIEDPDNIDATLHCYDSIDEIHTSDHKPVKAHLCLKINKQ